MKTQAPYFKIESFGSVDGPGIRLILFLQGCPLRCIYCHNPESWSQSAKTFITPEEVIAKFQSNVQYYKNGGITLSGGEPLIHQQFCFALAKLCYQHKINLAFDTSGCTFNKKNLSWFKKIIKYKPLWIIDIKHIVPKKHKIITGMTKQTELQLIKFLEKHKQIYWLRQVLLSKYTDNIQDLKKLGLFIKKLKHMVNFELLPYHRIGVEKYQQLGLSYKLMKSVEPTKNTIAQSKSIIQYWVNKK